MSFGIIYKITNTINNMIYIGQTKVGLKRRWYSHISAAKQNKRNNRFYNALTKYGKESFTLLKIDEATSQEELDNKEIYWIAYYKSNNKKYGYNSTSGGEYNKVYSEEVKRKISNANKGNKYCVGRRYSEETKQKIGQSLKTSEKFQASIIRKTKQIYCFETDETMTFKQFKEKYPEKHLRIESICRCCNRKQCTASGWHWCYIEDKETYVPIIVFDSRRKVYCLETKETFESIAAAKKAYPRCSSLEKVCAGIKYTTGGLHWCYLENKEQALKIYQDYI